MNPLLSILRAAHCRSTHHYFALDALPLVQTDPGKRLVGILLRYHDQYLTGAKDPDTRFRDFQNHVVHVADGYWGGAPRVAHRWYDRFQRYVREKRLADAAHAAGVISHYFTDPIQPLHTAQTPQEKVLHRPIEWSITKSYDDIHQIWQEQESRVLFRLSEGPGWLGEAILHAAKFAHRRYQPMIDAYRLDLGAKDPPRGFGPDGREIIADLFGIAITGWSRVLERMALETQLAQAMRLPKTSTSIASVLACLRVPTRLWIRRITNRRERASIQALVDEFVATGDVVKNLPHEVDVINRVIRVHNDEKAWKAKRQRQVESSETEIAITKDETQQDVSSAKPVPRTLPVPSEEQVPPATIPFPIQQTQRSVNASVAEARLHREDPLVDAPSIGPKTAKRFAVIGVHTVGEFLDQPASELAAKLDTRWMSATTLQHWQYQSQLMCIMPRMLAREVQLLVGAGYENLESILAADPKVLLQAMERFAETSAGKRYLRGGSVPTLDHVIRWQTTSASSSTVRRAA